jgi:hypothetical protein
LKVEGSRGRLKVRLENLRLLGFRGLRCDCAGARRAINLHAISSSKVNCRCE